jgi:hypothetical protein
MRRLPVLLGDLAPSITTNQRKRKTLIVPLLDSSPTIMMADYFTQSM